MKKNSITIKKAQFKQLQNNHLPKTDNYYFKNLISIIVNS